MATFADTKNQLNILLSNTTGFTFNDSEVTQILTDGWNDEYSVNPLVWDSSLTFSVSQFQYPIPATLTAVNEIYVYRSQDDNPDPIDASLWEVVNNNLQFTDKAIQIIPDGYPLYLKGRYKVQVTDTITDPSLIQYIIALAGYNALRYLLLKRTMMFLKNDTTIAEIIATRRELYADTIRWRQQIGQDFRGM